MNPDSTQREMLSALADGALGADEIDAALECAHGPAAQQAWHMYHLIGEVLRSPHLVHCSGMADVLPAVHAAQAAQAVAVLPRRAANDPVLRWKVAASCALLAAAAALGWHLLPPPPGDGQIADASASVPANGHSGAADFPLGAVAQSSPVMAVATPHGGGQSAMLHDPHLEARLASTSPAAGASAPPWNAPAAPLQMPAGFLRNASFAAAGSGHDCASARC